MTTHTCGHCGERFDEMADLHDHVQDCDERKCLVCGAEFDSLAESWTHSPCPEAEPVDDPEAEFREERRRRKQQQIDDRRVERDRRVGR